MKKLAIIFALALSLTFITACHGVHFGKGVKGSGVRKTENRVVPEFKGVEAGGAFEIEVTAQAENGLEIDGDDNILPLIKTEVRGGVLHIGSDKGFNVSEPIQIKISTKDIQSLDLSGASQAIVKNIKNDRFEIDVSGASNIKIQGETASLKIDSSGASKIDCEKLTARSVNVSTSGAGTTRVFASEELTAEASGASTIIYSGEPKVVNKKDSGASTITKK